MILLHGATQLVTPLDGGGFRVIEDAAIAAENGRIIYTGNSKEGLASFSAAEKFDVSGKVLLPGFVDAHTHLIFAGDRSTEFLMRLRGATYQEIAAAGGGIQSTVAATRAAGEEELLQLARKNLARMIQYGTTTVEVKSGYGLSSDQEQKLLRVANELKRLTEVDIAVTFLGAHDFPLKKSREDYVQEILNEMIPIVARNGLAEFCDVFHDQGYYDADQTRRISRKAREAGLKIKLHVDELADVNGASLAAELRAISADHLILANEAGIKDLAAAQVVAVLLPGTSFALKVPRHAPARALIEAGVRVAIATDFNPGTCYCHSMQYILQLATLLYGMTAEETITAATLNGAAALDRAHLTGSLEIGKQMDCLVFDIPHYSHLFYNLGVNRLETVIKKGKSLWSKKENRI